MKRIIGLVVIVAAFFFAMNYFGAKDKIEFKGLQNSSLLKITDNAYALKGTLVFFNPSSFSSQLGSVNIKIHVNNQFAGDIEQTFSKRISSKSSFYFPFEIRFTTDEVKMFDEKNTIEISGKSTPDAALFNYEIPISAKSNISF